MPLALFKLGAMTCEQLSVALNAHVVSVRNAVRALEEAKIVERVPLWSTLSLVVLTPPGAAAAAPLALVEHDARLFKRIWRNARQLAPHEHATAELLAAFVRWSDPPRRGLVDWQAPWLAARPFRREIPGRRLAGCEVRPDAAGTLVLPGGELPFFAETDMGTEGLREVSEKALRYVRALRPKRREAPWTVLFACPTARRAANVAEAVGAALEPGDEDVARFLVAARPALAEAGPFAAGAWEDAQTGDRVGLEELALWPLERDYSVGDGDFIGFPPRVRLPRDEAGRFLPHAPRDSMTSPRGGR